MRGIQCSEDKPSGSSGSLSHRGTQTTWPELVHSHQIQFSPAPARSFPVSVNLGKASRYYSSRCSVPRAHGIGGVLSTFGRKGTELCVHTSTKCDSRALSGELGLQLPGALPPVTPLRHAKHGIIQFFFGVNSS